MAAKSPELQFMEAHCKALNKSLKNLTVDALKSLFGHVYYIWRTFKPALGEEEGLKYYGNVWAALAQISFGNAMRDLKLKAVKDLPTLGKIVQYCFTGVPALYVTHSTDEITTLADRILSLDKGRIAGWESPPMTLAARVVGHAGEKAIVEIEGDGGEAAHLQVAVRARLGERVRLGLPAESIMLSGTHPGRTSATTVLPGEVIEIPEEGAGPVVSIFGQRIRLPRPGPDLSGSRVWVSVLRILPRPEPDDSQV